MAKVTIIDKGKVVSCGTSKAVRIPADMVKRLKLENGMFVEFEVDEHKRTFTGKVIEK